MDDTPGTTERKPAPAPRIEQIAEALRLFAAPALGVVEVRATSPGEGKSRIWSGFFRDLDAAAAAAAELAAREDISGVYFTPNPIDPKLFALAPDRMRPPGQSHPAGTDGDVTRRRWLLVDLDPVRQAKTNSSDEEHARALEAARYLVGRLTAFGFPEGILGSSGNGAHLVYEIDEPNDPATLDLVKRTLASLDALLASEHVRVDQAVGNACRIWKLPGTVARKAPHTTERPQRLAQILSRPDLVAIVARDALERVAAAAPAAPSGAPPARSHAVDPGDELARENHAAARKWLLAWIEEHGVPIARSLADKWWLPTCPWSHEHTTEGNDAIIGLRADGTIYYKCHHDHCIHRGWAELREHFEPGSKAKREEAKARAASEAAGAEGAPAPSTPREVADIIPGAERQAVVEAVRFLISAEEGGKAKVVHAALRNLYPLLDHPRTRRAALEVLEDAAAPRQILRALANAWIQKEGQPRVVAETITLRDHFAVDVGRLLHVFERGAYRPRGELRVRRRAVELLERWDASKGWTSYGALEVAEYIGVRAPSLWSVPPIDIINLRNGLLDIRTRELLPHSPDHLSAIQLPIEFRPGARCPAWEEFAGEVFPPDAYDADVPWQIAGWLAIPFTSLQKALMLLGGGSNGKSRFLAGLVAFLGADNVSSRTLQDLEENRFAVASLANRLANIAADLPGRDVEGSSVFKACTGEDAKVTLERKFKDAVDFKPFARLAFSCNTPPRCDDASPAFFRRWYVLKFDRVFDGKNERPSHQIDAELAAPDELSGILNRALDALPDVLERGITVTPSMAAALGEFRAATSPIHAWLEENLVIAASAMVPKRALVAAFNCDAAAKGRPSATPHSMTAAVKEWCPTVREAQRQVDGREGVHVWLGIGLRAQQPGPEPPPRRTQRRPLGREDLPDGVTASLDEGA